MAAALEDFGILLARHFNLGCSAIAIHCDNKMLTIIANGVDICRMSLFLYDKLRLQDAKGMEYERSRFTNDIPD